MNENFQELYGYVKSENMTDLGEQEFFNAYSSPEKFTELYEYVKSENMTDLSPQDFFNSYFVGAEVPDVEKKSEEITTELPLEDGSLEFQESEEVELQPQETEIDLDVNDFEIPDLSREGVRLNYDDEGNVVGESTHIMRTETDGQGNWFSFPSLFQNEDGSWFDMSESENWEDVYSEAERRGEVINFGKDKETAINFGEGSWKETPTKALTTEELLDPTKDFTEKDYFEGTLGDILRGFDNVTSLGLGDFVDDLARSVATGVELGVMAENASDLLLRGSYADEEDILSFLKSKEDLEKMGPSQEMMDYQKIYKENGESFTGVVLGLAQNPTVLPEIMISTMFALATNKDAVLTGLSILGAAAASGAGTGAAAGTVVLPGFGTVGGTGAGAIIAAASALPYAYAAAGTVLEMGSTFAELLQEEFPGEELTKEKIREAINDEEIYTKLRNKAIARGFTIGAVDLFTFKLGGRAAKNIMSKSPKGLTRATKVKALAAAGGIEAAGGASGEALARAVIGQKMDVSEISLEGLADMPSSVLSTIAARYAKPKYKINGGKATAEAVDLAIETMTIDQLQKIKIDIKNDYEGREQALHNKKIELQKQAEATEETKTVPETFVVEYEKKEDAPKEVIDAAATQSEIEVEGKKKFRVAVPMEKAIELGLTKETKTERESIEEFKRKASEKALAEIEEKVEAEEVPIILIDEIDSHMESVEKEIEAYDKKFAENKTGRKDLKIGQILDVVIESLKDGTYKEPKKLYDKRDKPYLDLIQRKRNRVKEVLGKLNPSGVLGVLGLPESVNIVSIQDDLLQESGELIASKDKDFSERLQNQVGEALAESRDLSFEGIMGPDSGLSANQKKQFLNEVQKISSDLINVLTTVETTTTQEAPVVEAIPEVMEEPTKPAPEVVEEVTPEVIEEKPKPKKKAVAKKKVVAKKKAAPEVIEEKIPEVVPVAKKSKDAIYHEGITRGMAVEVEEGVGLVIGFSPTGKLVYAPFKKSSRARTSADRFKGWEKMGVTAEQKKKLLDLQSKLEKQEQENSQKYGSPFENNKSNLVIGENISKEVGTLMTALKRAFGMEDTKIIILTDQDLNEEFYQKNGLYGDYSSVRSASISSKSQNEKGSTRQIKPGEHYIYIDSNLSPEEQTVVLSHEFGHVMEKTKFKQASKEVQDQIKNEYNKWYSKLTGKTIQQVTEETRDVVISQLFEPGPAREFNPKQDRYISSFSEWFADNVSKFVTTNKKPKNLLEKFFSDIANALKKIYTATKKKNKTFPTIDAWLEEHFDENKFKQDLEQSEISQQELDDLEVLFDSRNTQFQLDSDQISEGKKRELVDSATELMKEMQPELSGLPYEVQGSSRVYAVDIKENTELASKVRRMGLDELIGKKINLVMADQLKVDNKTRMGGPFFPLMKGLFKKVAWASIKESAAKAIVNGAINSDYSVVFNMTSSSIDSNSIMGETLIEMLSEKSSDKELFDLFKNNITSRKGKDFVRIKEIIKDSSDMSQFLDKLSDLNVKERATLIKNIVPSETVTSTKPLGKKLKDLGITIEKMRDINAEQFVADLPMGALTMVLKVTDKKGNPVTKETANEALILKDEQIAEGMPTHSNYPVYVRGEAVAILKETAPFWELSKNAMLRINEKIAGLLKKKESYTVNMDGKERVVKVENNTDGTRTIQLMSAKDTKKVQSEEVIPASRKTTTKTIVKKMFGPVVGVKDIGKRYSAKEAIANAYRSGQMAASQVFEVTEPIVPMYKEFVTRLSRSFPNLEVITDQQEFDDLVNNLASKSLSVKNQKVYGAVYEGKLYLNPDLENYNTPIHEFGHIWMNVAKNLEPGTYNRGIELIKGTDYVKQIEDSVDYKRVTDKMRKDGATDQEIRDYVLEEALATAIGDKGESFATAAQERDFNTWIKDLFDFVKKLTGISKISSEQLQNLTLDEFLQGVVVDILSENNLFVDAELNQMSDNLQLMTSNEGLDINSIVQIARREGFSDESIKLLLKKRKFKGDVIKEALAVNIDLETKLPKEFANIEGGAVEGKKMFDRVKEKVNQFSRQGPRGGKGKVGVRTKKFTEIRAKAQELLKNDPTFQEQDAQVQMELLSAFDRVLGIKSNRNISREIGDIRKKLKERRIGAKNLKEAQREMRSVVRKMMPKSQSYSLSSINKLMRVINNTNAKNVDGQMIYVLDEIERQRQKAKKDLIIKMIKLVKKIKPRRTTSGKRRAGGLDAVGTSYFQQVKKVLNLVQEGDYLGLIQLQEGINQNTLEEIKQKILKGEDITIKESELYDTQLALDGFSEVVNMQLEDVQELFQEVKRTKTEAIRRFNDRKKLKREAVDEVKEDFNEQLKEDFNELYTEEGKPLGKQSLDQRRERIRSAFKNNGVFEGVKQFISQFKEEGTKYTTNSLASFFTNTSIHLGTVANLLDRGKEGVFTKYFYKNLNNLDENNLQGVRIFQRKLDQIAESTVGKKWSKWKYSLGTDVIQIKAKDSETSQVDEVDFSKDQSLRVYALSLNDVQRKKILNQIGENGLNKIETFLTADEKLLIERVVDFLSNQYFEDTNNIFSQVNDVNLKYIDNYFPTRTISNAEISRDMLGGAEFLKIFDAEFSDAVKDRVDQKSDVDLKYSFTEVLEDHSLQMERYKAYALTVQQMNEVLKDKGIINTLKETGMYDIFKQTLSYSINPTSGPAVPNDIISKIQRSFTGFALAFKLIQIPKQMSSFVQAYDKYPSSKFRGLSALNFMIDNAKVLGNFKNEIKESRDMSATFDSRVKKGLEGEIFGLESGSRTYKPLKAQQGKKGRISRAFQKATGITTVIGDILGVIAYKANYNANIRNGMSKAQALREFNDYNATQQSRRPTEKTPLQMRNDAFARAFTMFGSTIFLQQNKVIQSLNTIIKEISKGKIPKSRDIKTLALNYAVANVLFTGAAYSMNFIAGDDEDKDRALKAMMDAGLGLNLIFGIPLLGSAIESATAMISGERGFASDVVNPFKSVFNKIWKAIEKAEDGNPVKVAQPIIEISIGAQLDAPISLINFIGGDTSEENFYDLIGVSKSYRPGYGRTESKKKKKGTSKSKLKLIDPELYNEIYGEATEDEKNNARQIRQEINKEIRDALK